jgi:hypothetical protein
MSEPCYVCQRPFGEHATPTVRVEVRCPRCQSVRTYAACDPCVREGIACDGGLDLPTLPGVRWSGCGCLESDNARDDARAGRPGGAA